MKFQPQALTPTRSARHFYGAELRLQRKQAELSLVQLSEIVNSSKSALARVETAELLPAPGLSETLDAAFGTEGLFQRLYELVRREVHPDQYRRYMDFEAEARVIEHYAAHVVPGLLQTEAYARAFFNYAPDATEARTEERVAVRIGRQARLRSDTAPRLWAVLDEAVIRRPVGGPQVMQQQLATLLSIVDTPRTKVQVLPFSHGGHALMEGPLTLLRLPSGGTVAYEEGRDTGRLHEDLEAVEQRRALYDALRAYALAPKETATLLTEVMEDYKSCEEPQA